MVMGMSSALCSGQVVELGYSCMKLEQRTNLLLALFRQLLYVLPLAALVDKPPLAGIGRSCRLPCLILVLGFRHGRLVRDVFLAWQVVIRRLSFHMFCHQLKNWTSTRFVGSLVLFKFLVSRGSLQRRKPRVVITPVFSAET
jgi:hypothetical protein